MKVKILSVTFFVLLTSNISFAQLSSLGPHYKIDSLKIFLLQDKEDSNKVFHLFMLSRELSVKNTDTAIILAQQAVSLSEKLKWNKGSGYAAIVLGWAQYVQGDNYKALEANFSALKIGEETSDKTIVSLALSNIGQNYYAEGDGKKAIEFNYKALKIAEELKDDWNIARNTGVIGSSYQLLKDYPKAINYYFRAYELTEKIGNKNGSAVWLGNIGGAYKDCFDYPKALYYLEKSATIFDSIGNEWSYAETINDIGVIFFLLKQYEKSYHYLHEAYQLSSKVGALEGSKNVCLALSNLYNESDINLPDSSGKKRLNQVAMRMEALNYYKNYIVLRDTLFNVDRQKKYMRIEFENSMAKAKTDQDKKDLINQQQVQKQRIIRNTFIVGSILLLLLIVLLINRNQLKSKIAMEKMRNRLSRDLHDDIGSTLSSINILSRTAQTNLHHTGDEKTKTSLEKINERSQRLLDNMSDIIWNINPGNDTIEEVMSRMREYATTILEAKNIDYVFDFPKEKMDCRLNMEVKNNMYLIFKEAVNNLSKYSGCTIAKLSLTFDEKNIHMKIEDNGKGFNDDEIKHRGGLNNLQHRAEEIKGVIKIDSVIEKGTIVELTMPRYC